MAPAQSVKNQLYLQFRFILLFVFTPNTSSLSAICTHGKLFAAIVYLYANKCIEWNKGVAKDKMIFVKKNSGKDMWEKKN